MKTTPGMENVEAIGFPDMQPIAQMGCYDTAIDPQWGIILLCGRPKDHTGRHACGNGEIITRVWGNK